jgi:hypothetical protein
MSPKTTLAAVLAAATLLPAAAAQAAGPSATTGGASAITSSSATLSGTVNPHGSATSWYFQFGTTKAYGDLTPTVSAGSGTADVAISAPITGLASGTLYHYRLVAVGAGAVTGSDKTFTSAKIPLSLSIGATPNPVPYGAPLQIQGTLAGTGNGGRAIQLQADPFPYTPLAPSGLPDFQPIGNPLLTNADGSYAFTLAAAPAVDTQFRVVTLSAPQITSPVITASVALRVSVSVRRARARSGFLARFNGTITPAQSGARVGVERLIHGAWKAVGGTLARGSRYAATIHITGAGGFFRVIALPLDMGAMAPGYSAGVLVRSLR